MYPIEVRHWYDLLFRTGGALVWAVIILFHRRSREDMTYPVSYSWWWWSWGSHQDLLISVKCLLHSLTLSFHERVTTHYYLPTHYHLHIYQLHFQAGSIYSSHYWRSLLNETEHAGFFKLLSLRFTEAFTTLVCRFTFPSHLFQLEFLSTFLLPSICQ